MRRGVSARSSCRDTSTAIEPSNSLGEQPCLLSTLWPAVFSYCSAVPDSYAALGGGRSSPYLHYLPACVTRALAYGAHDCVTKPSRVQGASEGSQRIREQLIPKVKALCGRRAIPPLPAAPVLAPPISRPDERASKPDIVAIGTSAGGPNALAEILPRIPGDFPLPILIVQHMPPAFTAFLAERLSASSRIPVKEASPQAEVGPGQAWIAPASRVRDPRSHRKQLSAPRRLFRATRSLLLIA
ncbi:MAG: chemotaxis protein CheB [Terriglobales bacterium]